MINFEFWSRDTYYLENYLLKVNYAYCKSVELSLYYKYQKNSPGELIHQIIVEGTVGQVRQASKEKTALISNTIQIRKMAKHLIDLEEVIDEHKRNSL